MSCPRSSGRLGQSVLYAVLMMPMLFLVFALAIDIGAMQLERLRLHDAVDLAAVTAASNVDGLLYRRTGDVRVDEITAAATARDYLRRNLVMLADTPNPDAIAAAADIAVVNQVPSRDPFSGQLLDRPAVCARIRVRYRFSLLQWAGLTGGVLVVNGDAEIRE